MRAAIHTQFGDPAKVLELGERPTPQPGKGQVRVAMRRAPIHNHDLWTVRGNYGYKPELPAIGGSEAAGVIDALGEGVEGLQVGQRVVAAGVHEAWAEYFLADASGVVPLPDGLDDERGCQLIAMPLSALMLIEFLQVKQGDWIVQNTANGAVGKTVAMLAAARGIQVINLVRRDAGVEELAALGIGNAVSTAQDGWQAQVRALAGDAPIVRAIDSVAGNAAGELMALLAEGGELISFGAMTGEPLQISSGDVIFKQATVRGFWGSKVMQATKAEDKRRMIGELLTAALDGSLALPVEAVFDLHDAAKAAAASDEPGRSGKILLRAG
ncbi:zinc-binding dehydrogenase [Xanthomonas campestris pv. raphani]|uniref:zinc-binding dehydrogenase n=1 Tax=Xanthomonas campestris TaxID=339 RepID=UPI00021AF5EF|nr:zinc-binding dehydrogenase [Xanthomonas campestris]MEB2184017.1 zinc-binding dehydrogenase [Xanthomonas campestris pv. campestris]AEL09313.1 NADPH quinone reductase or zn-dependent oxidoreductase [Xanthomonas campestris pv. raphani 756C]MEA9656398.1 zinc-binding dehydrogenase [Xanthomonas campestris pv. raphani]MEA9676814.1 zinc-binding dehydrogenase [Xanthomonas campestris pv. raphani]MEA9753223.1 zinc-binding dehydrogenase [Xanthomonas campestris pv. raphani]